MMNEKPNLHYLRKAVKSLPKEKQTAFYHFLHKAATGYVATATAPARSIWSIWNKLTPEQKKSAIFIAKSLI